VEEDDFFIKKEKPPSPFTHQLPPERVWTVAPVSEKAAVFLTWLADCQVLVDQHFGVNVFTLQCKPITNYLWITMRSSSEIRVFAFISKLTGDIHCPALFDEPFASSHGNIVDAITRLSTMCAWGVKTPWSWLPTFADSTRFNKR
jgi:hypothetical protein